MPSRSLHASALLTGMALVTGMALGAAACGSGAPGTSAGVAATSATPTVTGSVSPTAAGSVPPTVSGSVNPPAAGPCGGSAKPAPPGGTLTLGSRDNRGTFCLRVGQQVIVYLQGSPAHMWAPIRSDSSVLRPAPNGSLMLMRGVTGAAFTAARPGTAHITSARPVCIGGPIRCDALIAYQVTVVVAMHAP